MQYNLPTLKAWIAECDAKGFVVDSQRHNIIKDLIVEVERLQVCEDYLAKYWARDDRDIAALEDELTALRPVFEAAKELLNDKFFMSQYGDSNLVFHLQALKGPKTHRFNRAHGYCLDCGEEFPIVKEGDKCKALKEK